MLKKTLIDNRRKLILQNKTKSKVKQAVAFILVIKQNTQNNFIKNMVKSVFIINLFFKDIYIFC